MSGSTGDNTVGTAPVPGASNAQSQSLIAVQLAATQVLGQIVRALQNVTVVPSGAASAASVVSGSAVALTTATPVDVTTLPLAAGKWAVFGAVYFTGAGITTVTRCAGSIGTVANTLATTPGQFSNSYLAAATVTNIGEDVAVTGIGTFVTLGAPAIYHLVARADFAVSTLGAYGIIFAIPTI